LLSDILPVFFINRSSDIDPIWKQSAADSFDKLFVVSVFI